MSFNIENLQQARYKDYSFSFKEESTAAGRSKIINEFSNQDFDSIEDGGKIPRFYEFVVTISGENFARDRKKLLDLADEETSGQLVHPIDGRIDNVYLMPIKISTSISAVGYSEIPVVFRVGGKQGSSPVAVENKKLALQQNYDLSFQQLEDSFSKIETTQPKTRDSVFEKFGNVLSDFSNPKSLIGNATEFSQQISKFSNFTNSIYSLTSSPKAMANQFVSILKSSYSLFSTPSDVISTQSAPEESRDLQITEFDKKIPTRNTIASVESANAENTINSTYLASQALNVSLAYSEIDFDSDVEVVAAMNDLTRIKNTLYFEDVDARESVNKTIDSSIDYLSDVKIEQKKFVSKDFNNMPASVISFQMFGDSSKTKEIMRANKDINISYYDGEVKLLT